MNRYAMLGKPPRNREASPHDSINTDNITNTAHFALELVANVLQRLNLSIQIPNTHKVPIAPIDMKYESGPLCAL